MAGGGGGGGFRGPRGMMGGGAGAGGGAGNFKMMSMRGRRIAVGGGGPGGVTTTNSPTSPPSKPSSRCTSPTRAHHQKPLTSSNKGGFSSGYGLESPLSPYFGWPAGFAGEEYEWVSYDGGSYEEEEDEVEVHDVSEEEGFLGPVPSPEEVHSAVSALTQVFGTSSYSQTVRDKYAYSAADAMDQISSPIGMLRRVASVGTESDWLEPSPNLCNTRMSRSFGSDRVYDAFHMLQTDPSVQKMVISLSSDRAVWDAVLNNEAVRELRQTYSSDVNGSTPSLEGSASGESAGKANPALNVILWMLDSTRAKFVDIFDTLSRLVNALLKTPEEAEKDIEPLEPDQPNDFDKMMRTSFHLSIIVLLLVAMTRAIGKARP